MITRCPYCDWAGGPTAVAYHVHRVHPEHVEVLPFDAIPDPGYVPSEHYRSSDGRGTKSHPTCKGETDPCSWPYCFDHSLTDAELEVVARLLAPVAPRDARSRVEQDGSADVGGTGSALLSTPEGGEA